MKKFFLQPLFYLLLVLLFFFHSFILKGLLPIPADTIIGLYHPFRDLYAVEYPNGIPYKNFLITDPVRQQYPWRSLAIDLEKEIQMPLWNPYSFAGTPLLANFQTAAFYPLNILLFIFQFSIGWSLLIFLQPLLAGLFLYFYLRKMRLSEISSLLGSIVYAFCGFSTAWLEWNSLGQVALWLPLILLAKENLLKKVSYKWLLVLIFAECSAFFAGHLQTFFYLILLVESYLLARIFQITKKENSHFWQHILKKIVPFAIAGLLIVCLTAIAWLPAVQFISISARNADQINSWLQAGWFVPWQNLVQFVAPDFFGNPATLNYWGIWNYAEFIGYVGIFPFLIAIYALFFRRDKKTLFFGTVFFLSLIFSLPTIFAKVPYLLQIPFLSTSQPTRLLFLTDFSLAVLAAFGFDFFLQTKKKSTIIYPILFLIIIFIGLWSFVFSGYKVLHISVVDNTITKHNLYLPTLFFLLTVLLACSLLFLKSKKVTVAIALLLVVLTTIDLFRFSDKFIPFTNPNYLFPSTAALSYLQNQKGEFRIMTTNSEIMPPNFSVMYHLQSLDGYDPLYLQSYGEMMAAISRNKPDILPPFGFNRIITPTNISSRLIDLFGVKYVLSLSDLHEKKLVKVFSEGQTQIYQNRNAFPRIFFVTSIKSAHNKNETIHLLFDNKINLHTTAIVEQWNKNKTHYSNGQAKIMGYKENSVEIRTKNNAEGFLVLTDTFYPTWHVTVDGKEGKLYRTDYNFRGVFIPKGNHRIVYYDTLL